MRHPDLFNVSRDGKELGLFRRKEVLSKLKSGEFLESDHFWEPNMNGWEPLRAFPELRSTTGGQRTATARQRAYLNYLGVSLPQNATSKEASEAIEIAQVDNRINWGRVVAWEFQKLILHPDLFADELEDYLGRKLPNEFTFEYIKSQVVDSSKKVTRAQVEKVFASLASKDKNWWHNSDRLERAYQELKAMFPACCDGKPARIYVELPEALHTYVRSRVVGCSEKLTKAKIIQVVDALIESSPGWYDKPNRNEIFWGRLKEMFPACCDGQAPVQPNKKQDAPKSTSKADEGKGTEQAAGCALVLLAVPVGVVAYLLLSPR